MAELLLSENWHRFENIQPSHSKRFGCCTLTILHIMYSKVCLSIVSISDLGAHICIGYRPSYCTISDITLVTPIRNVPNNNGYSYHVLACFGETSQIVVVKNN